MRIREDQVGYLEKALVCAGKAEAPAQELVASYLKEFARRFEVEKYAFFRIAEQKKVECIARCGIGDTVITLLGADIQLKLPDFRFYQPYPQKAAEILLPRKYLLLGEGRVKFLFVAYGVLRRRCLLEKLSRSEFQLYCDVFSSCIAKALKQEVLECSIGCSEFSGMKGFYAFYMDYESATHDAYVLLRISDISILYETLSPVAFLEFIRLLSERVRGAVVRRESVYQFGDSYYLLALNGEKWDVYQRVKLLLGVLNDMLCDKRPLACPDMDIRAGLVYDGDSVVEQLIPKLFMCAKRAEYASVYVYGQLNGTGTKEGLEFEFEEIVPDESVLVVLEEGGCEEETEDASGSDAEDSSVGDDSVLGEGSEDGAGTATGTAELDDADIGRLFGINY